MPDTNSPPSTSFSWKSADGLTLAGVHWAPPQTEHTKIPVLCLPGLSRNTRDFGPIAQHLQANGFPVYALDYRGRGKSDWDAKWENYTIPIEASDIDLAIQQLKLDTFALLGTSRGGIHGMAMALRYDSSRMKGIILNDIGPDIPMSSLIRIRDSLGQKMKFSDWPELSKHLKAGLGGQFTALNETDWVNFARQLGSDKEGSVVLEYDPRLRHQLDGLENGEPFPDLWPLLSALKDRSVLIIRGENSDLLNLETAEQMLAECQTAEAITIPNEGHAPLLWDQTSQSKMTQFLNALR